MAPDDDTPWHVPLLPDYRRCSLSRTARDVMVAICARARTKPYAWVSNEDLAEATGLHRDSVKRGLRELVREGWIRRAMEDCRRTRRVGVILLKRPDGLLHPVAEDWPLCTWTIEALRRDRAEWQARQRVRPMRAAGMTGRPPEVSRG